MKNVFSNALITGLMIFGSIVVLNAQGLYKMSLTDLPQTRQVHMDFHTSECIEGVGSKFDKKQFQRALKVGHINQINIFAKGHHSLSYYPTKVGIMHPHLDFDLLGEEIKACHEIGVKCPIYFTVGWSDNDYKNHPEWCARNQDGSYKSSGMDYYAKLTDAKPFGVWTRMCFAKGGDYHAYIMKNVEEICKRYPDFDGFWFDIYHVDGGCYCTNCLKRMKKEGVDINDSKAVEMSYVKAVKAHQLDLRKLIAKYNPKATVFFNGTTHIKDNIAFRDKIYEYNTQQELEDLPTAWGGYDKLPLESKFHLQHGTPTVAMSGKFHRDWGEFGGFKSANAIKYEAAAMISYGTCCNFGDQMHPTGFMDMSTYKRIGEAYKYIEKIEQYGPGGMPESRLGMWITNRESADLGVVNMLLEMHYDFMPANENNLNQFELVIMPSRNCLTDKQANKINDYVAQGGKLLVFGQGALSQDYKKLVLNVGAEYQGHSSCDVDYTVINDESLRSDMVESPFLNYRSGLRIKPTTGKSLAAIRDPYFNRTYGHFTSHKNTPFKMEDSGYSAVVKNGNVIFITSDLDQMYYEHAMKLDRDLVKNCIDMIYTKPMLKVYNLPSSGRVSFLHQSQNKRYIAHILYTPVLSRGDVKVVEDFLPIPNVKIQVRVNRKIESVKCIPADKKLRFIQKNGIVTVKVPTFTMHTGIVLNYK